MLVFPQLTTGAAALYPVTKQGLRRTVVNTMADGSTVVYADADASIAGWTLRATGLTLAEWNATQTTKVVSGRMNVVLLVMLFDK